MPFTFPEELLVGVAPVDEQHRSFYRQLNDLHAAMRVHDLPAAGRAIDFLMQYVTEHFAMEERLMVETGYPGTSDHLARHREFAKDLKRWHSRYAADGATASLVVELSSTLTSWLGDHIRKVDGAMARYLRDRPAAR